MKPKLLNNKDLILIEGILTRWSGKLTWPAFAEVVARELGRSSISEYTLMSYEPIKQAYRRRKETQRKAKEEATAPLGDVTIDTLIAENARLREQIVHLQSELKIKEVLWKETFVRWSYNLSQMPEVDMSKLMAEVNQPLPANNRDD
ncbi:hypothetical protein [Vreelandella alkaliphila]|uniref:hypothetical protein n=1 Tax=Vreelandella alkaliphila TaxID=272774 RepID=UPI003FD87A8E